MAFKSRPVEDCLLLKRQQDERGLSRDRDLGTGRTTLGPAPEENVSRVANRHEIIVRGVVLDYALNVHIGAFRVRKVDWRRALFDTRDDC